MANSAAISGAANAVSLHAYDPLQMASDAGPKVLHGTGFKAIASMLRIGLCCGFELVVGLVR